mgnify:CR=1 FL=1
MNIIELINNRKTGTILKLIQDGQMTTFRIKMPMSELKLSRKMLNI